MTHLNVEDGTGVIALANSYVGVAEADNYHVARGNAAWAAAATEEIREEALIRATDYIETRFGQRFLGRKQFIDLELAAIGHFNIPGSNVVNNDTVTIGVTVYTFVPSPSAAFEVDIGADAAGSVVNLDAAINLTGVAGTTYGVGTTIHPDFSSEVHVIGLPGFLITAKVKGIIGNGVVLATSDGRANWDTAITLGGQDTGEQPLSFPRLNLWTRDGTLVSMIPQALKNAQMEYALSALAASLWLAPTQDATGLRVIGSRSKVGPIETETRFAENTTVSTIKPLPQADRLLNQYLAATGTVIR